MLTLPPLLPVALATAMTRHQYPSSRCAGEPFTYPAPPLVEFTRIVAILAVLILGIVVAIEEQSR